MTELSDFFARRDMSFEELEDTVVRTAFATTLADGSEHAFPLFVLQLEDDFGGEYVRFTVVPFLEQPADQYHDSLYQIVGRFNHDLPQLKLAFDADGDLEMLIDLPAEELNDERFDRCIQLLAEYGGAYYHELTTASSL